ncbi:hypothetical protein B0A55_13563 [Friedmanniomyces simplex]|uniref:Uncharacterized protein n=1 Tax=Friedmanniomyces simplex TaxID=329884 RepID=A0A4U0WN45_9PEZI|nr:hypothetical protein B0A55_13563 [Friedmanniomyces simplex]
MLAILTFYEHRNPYDGAFSAFAKKYTRCKKFYYLYKPIEAPLFPFLNAVVRARAAYADLVRYRVAAGPVRAARDATIEAGETLIA